MTIYQAGSYGPGVNVFIAMDMFNTLRTLSPAFRRPGRLYDCRAGIVDQDGDWYLVTFDPVAYDEAEGLINLVTDVAKGLTGNN